MKHRRCAVSVCEIASTSTILKYLEQYRNPELSLSFSFYLQASDVKMNIVAKERHWILHEDLLVDIACISCAAENLENLLTVDQKATMFPSGWPDY